MFKTLKQQELLKAAGAAAVMALERIPADIRAAGGVSRMSDPKMIKEIQEAVSIPVMAKVRIPCRCRTSLPKPQADEMPIFFCFRVMKTKTCGAAAILTLPNIFTKS